MAVKLKDSSNMALLGTARLNLDKLFNAFCEEEVTDNMIFIQKIVKTFGEEVARYKNTEVYAFTVGYAHNLIDQIERVLYPGKLKPEITRNTLRMNYSDFVEYIKDPEPGDMVTVLNDNGGNLARIKVRTVINT